MSYQINLKDIKERIFKAEDGWNNYINVSIEEMDWLVEQAEILKKVTLKWAEIEANGTYEETTAFYSDFQDILNENADY